jgi:diaminohydroxyphosphoribosylaminopyrimidine deaminase/5-amino-6-(5-phosphoribosylamino)uracil reductase
LDLDEMNRSEDIFYMRKVLALAKRGRGKVSPNPLVGAVLVKEGRIIGTGYHRKYGGPHAEVEALESANRPVEGATLYCNLEPCCHVNKQTPPCAHRIIKEKIKRVVIADVDPNAEVNGRGVRLLQEAGITVIQGVEKARHRELNRFFIKHMMYHMPYITVKIAQTIDAKIGEAKDKKTWLTCEESVKKVHRWRSWYDAVLVGANTIRTDWPQLTVRALTGRDPIRIIISARLALPQNEFYKGEHTLIVTGEKSIIKYRDPTSRILRIREQRNGHVSMKTILRHLSDMGIASLLVEGGHTIFSQFVFSDLADELKIFIAPVIWGYGTPSFSQNKKRPGKYALQNIERSDQDVLLTYRKRFFSI